MTGFLELVWERLLCLRCSEECPLVAVGAIIRVSPIPHGLRRNSSFLGRISALSRYPPLNKLRTVAASATIENHPAGSIVIEEDRRE